jgi:hypothetical protein
VTQQLPRVLSTTLILSLLHSTSSISTYVPVQTLVNQEQLHCTYKIESLGQ